MLKNPDLAEYKIHFNLNKIVNKMDPSCQKVEICVFTCWCSDKNCKMHPEYSDYDLKK